MVSVTIDMLIDINRVGMGRDNTVGRYSSLKRSSKIT